MSPRNSHRHQRLGGFYHCPLWFVFLNIKSVAPEAEELARGVRRILGNREDYISRGLARAKEFSWQKTAQETVEIYKELATNDAHDTR